jgi:hypothetical protein
MEPSKRLTLMRTKKEVLQQARAKAFNEETKERKGEQRGED